MDKYFQLMCKDVLVADQKEGWKVYHPELLPHNLDLNPTQVPNSFLIDARKILLAVQNVQENVDTIVTQLAIVNYERSQFVTWLSRRVLSIDRVNAKKILNALRLSQNQSPDEKSKISIAYRGISLCDSWWLKFGDEDDATWDSINLYKNSLNEYIALIGLSGGAMPLNTKPGLVAELSTKGSYAKGWFREGKNGQLFLYKASTKGNNESEREVCASQIIDCFNVYGNLKYSLETKINPLNKTKSMCSKCLIMSDPNLAVVHAAEFDSYLRRHGSDVISYVKKNYKREFAQMVVIDYLVANTDRHGENWGFFRSMIDGAIKGLHPLYDHNNAFDPDALDDEDFPSVLMDGKSLKIAAKYAVRDAGLKLIKIPDVKLFPNKKSYNTFVKRCKQLELWGTIADTNKLKKSNIFKK